MTGFELSLKVWVIIIKIGMGMYAVSRRGVIDDFNKKEGSSSVPVGAQKRVKKMGGIASCEGPMR